MGAPRLRDVVAYERALPPRWVSRLRAQVLEVGGSLDGATVWYDLAAPPRTFFEEVVGQLYRGVLGGRGYVGAEYWLRAQKADAVFFLHFDRDEGVRGRYVCPARSSVLYLSEVGGPTVILPATPETEARPRSAAIVWPSPGRYALFPGDLLHGVLPGPASRWPRVAFFVNWWRAPLVSRRESTPELRRTSPPAGLTAPARPGPRRSRAMPERIDSAPFLPAEVWPQLRDSRRAMAG